VRGGYRQAQERGVREPQGIECRLAGHPGCERVSRGVFLQRGSQRFFPARYLAGGNPPLVDVNDALRGGVGVITIEFQVHAPGIAHALQVGGRIAEGA